MFKRLIASLVCLVFIFSNLQYVQAQDFSIDQLPVPGTMVGVSTPFIPLALKGLIVNPKKPLEFQFIVDTGRGPQDTASVKDQADQLVKYFLAGLTIPEGDLWVNLSPYEKNRMVPEALGQTDLGRDLLAQDYILKQLTASLIYPEKDLGKEFWSRVYAKAQKQFGTTNIPVNTFNKVWILPDQAQVFENKNAAYVTKSTLKVMLDEDYTALQKHVSLRGGEADAAISKRTTNDTHTLASQIVRAIILPEIEKEVNTGKNFAPLRQIYQALILAKWYKETIQNGLLDAIYTNKNKVAGVNLDDPTLKEQIYERYLRAYKKGAFNYIKDDSAPDGQVMPRKYFSGGLQPMPKTITRGSRSDIEAPNGAMMVLNVDLEKPSNNAMTAEKKLVNFSSYNLAESLGYFNLERELLWGGREDPQRQLSGIIKPQETSDNTQLEQMYTDFTEQGKPVDHIESAPIANLGTWSEAQGYSLFLRKKSDILRFSSLSQRIRINDDFFLELVPERNDIPMDGDGADNLREQVKLGTVLNSLDSEENFVRYLGEENRKYFSAIQTVRNAGAIVLTGVPGQLTALKEAVAEALNDPSININDVFNSLKSAVDKFVDLNDLLLEVALRNVKEGVWGYNNAAQFLFLQQIVMGVVSKDIVKQINEGSKYFPMANGGHTVGVQYNPGRAKRASTGKMEGNETLLSLRFIKRVLPLERAIPFEGNYQYNIFPNPFPHLRNSINVVRQEEPGAYDTHMPPQVPDGKSMEDMLSLLTQFRPEQGQDRFRLFINGRFAGFSFDHMHYQGFMQRAKIEDAFDNENTSLDLVKESNGVKVFKPKAGKWWMSTMLVFTGTDKQKMAQAIEESLRKTNEDGSLALNRKSKFAYNILFTFDEKAQGYKVFVFIRNANPKVMTKPSDEFFDADVVVVDPKELGENIFSGRPAVVELADSLIYGTIHQEGAYNKVVEDRERTEHVFAEIAKKVEYKGFDDLVKDLAMSQPLAQKQTQNAAMSSRIGHHQYQHQEYRPNNPTKETSSAENGGIDLNQINVNRTGKTVNVQFNQAQLNEILQGGFEGFTPVITNMTRISSPLPLLGIEPAKEEEKVLAGV